MAEREQLETRVVGGVTVVRLCQGRITDGLEIEQLGRELYKLAEGSDGKKVLLDFSSVEFLSSAAIGKLISLNGRLKSRGGMLKLCGVRPQILTVFRICALERVLDIKPDQASALAAF